jgi:hypothetical protein
MSNNSKILLPRVRLSFPSLFRFSTFGGDSTEKYDATFILDNAEHKTVIASIQSQIAVMVKEAFKTKTLPADKICLKDGSDSGREELEGKMVIKASTKKRPMVLGKDKAPITEEDNIIYGGCYVNAVISLWPQDNQWGRRLNASLLGVQFHSDGEAFGDAGIGAEAFDAFPDAEDDIAF